MLFRRKKRQLDTSQFVTHAELIEVVDEIVSGVTLVNESVILAYEEQTELLDALRALATHVNTSFDAAGSTIKLMADMLNVLAHIAQTLMDREGLHIADVLTDDEIVEYLAIHDVMSDIEQMLQNHSDLNKEEDA